MTQVMNNMAICKIIGTCLLANTEQSICKMQLNIGKTSRQPSNSPTNMSTMPIYPTNEHYICLHSAIHLPVYACRCTLHPPTNMSTMPIYPTKNITSACTGAKTLLPCTCQYMPANQLCTLPLTIPCICMTSAITRSHRNCAHPQINTPTRLHSC